MITYFHLITNPDANNVKDIGYQSRAITLPVKSNGSGDRYKAGGMPRHVHLKMEAINCRTDVDDSPYVHNISVYPNPVENILNIKDLNKLSSEDINYEIYHLTTGNTIKTGKTEKSEINVADLTPGFYGIRLNNKIIKFIKI